MSALDTSQRLFYVARRLASDKSMPVEVTGVAMSALTIGIKLALDHPDEARQAIAQMASAMSHATFALRHAERYCEYIATGSGGSAAFDSWVQGEGD